MPRTPWMSMRAVAIAIAAAVCVQGQPVARVDAAEDAAQNPAAAPRFEVAFATYLGGANWDEAREVIECADGTILIGAQSSSVDMPTTEGSLQPQYAGDDPALGASGVYGGDCWLARVSGDGGKVLAATFFGGSRQERNVYGLALDRANNPVIASATRSLDAPTTEGGFQMTFGGGASDMLVAKLSADLCRLIWCTYVGGRAEDSPRGGLTLDDQDNVIVVGTTSSPDFPTTWGTVQPRLRGARDSAIVKLSSDGTRLIFGTYLGGSGEDDAVMGVRLDGRGNLHLAGHTKSTDFPVTPSAAQPKAGGESDCYLASLDSNASRILHATYLGGRGNEFAEHRPLLLDDGTMVLTGFTGSDDFPSTPGACQSRPRGKSDGFVTSLSPDGSRWIFSTCIGGSEGENWLMPTRGPDGNIFVVGSTSSHDFPVTEDALQKEFGGGREDAAIALLSADGSRLLYASYLGGRGDDLIRCIAVTPRGELLLAGRTSSDDFPVSPGAIQNRHRGGGDAFLVKLAPCAAR